jgi:hypothetical protein
VDLLQRSQENEKEVMASGEEEEEREGQTRKTASV